MLSSFAQDSDLSIRLPKIVIPEPRCLQGHNSVSLSDHFLPWSSTGGGAPYPMENIKTLRTKETQTKKFSSLREKLVDGPDLQISRFYDILQLCFCLWGYLKSKVYCPRPNNLNELQAKISNEVAQIDPAMVRRAVMDMKARAVKCIAAGGGHFEK